MIFIILVANDFSIKMNSKGQSNDSLCITDGVQTPLSYSGQKQQCRGQNETQTQYTSACSNLACVIISYCSDILIASLSLEALTEL